MLIIYTLMLALSTSQVPAPSDDALSDVDGKDSAAGESIEEIVEKWVVASKECDTYCGSFRIFEYDKSFMTEKRGLGRYWIGGTQAWRIDVHPDPDAQPGDKHHSKDKTYTVEPSKERTMSRCNEKIYYSDLNVVDLLVLQKPLNGFWRRAIIDSASAGQIVMLPHTCESILTRHAIEMEDKTETGIHLRLFPKDKTLRSSYQRIEIILDKDSYLPTAAKVIDPSGNSEVTYVFGERDKRVCLNKRVFKLDKLPSSQKNSVKSWTLTAPNSLQDTSKVVDEISTP